MALGGLGSPWRGLGWPWVVLGRPWEALGWPWESLARQSGDSSVHQRARQPAEYRHPHSACQSVKEKDGLVALVTREVAVVRRYFGELLVYLLESC